MNSETAASGKAYNIRSMSISPADMEQSIKEQIPDFKCTYKPDFRQKIADSWPSNVEDQDAQNEWNWKPKFDLQKTTQEMLNALRD
jgi:nucleoside-diphosphate-sugar epimerase